MVLMNGAKKARNVQSVTNNICNLGGPKKGGLVTMQGKNANLYTVITNQGPYCCVETNLGCIAGLAYLKAKNLMTMNPQCSGGVPHRMYRGCRSSCSTIPEPSVIQLSDIATGSNSVSWTLTNPAAIPFDSSLTIPTGHTLTLNAPLINNGTLTIYGTIVNYANLSNSGIGIIHNQSNTIDNRHTMDNRGTINNDGVITNAGIITNYPTGKINVSVNGNVTNQSGATINNTGTVAVHPDATLVNYGMLFSTSAIPVSGSPTILSTWYSSANFE